MRLLDRINRVHLLNGEFVWRDDDGTVSLTPDRPPIDEMTVGDMTGDGWECASFRGLAPNRPTCLVLGRWWRRSTRSMLIAAGRGHKLWHRNSP